MLEPGVGSQSHMLTLLCVRGRFLAMPLQVLFPKLFEFVHCEFNSIRIADELAILVEHIILSRVLVV